MHAWLQEHVRVMLDTLPKSARPYAWLCVAETSFGPVDLAEGDVRRVTGLLHQLVALATRQVSPDELRGVLHLHFASGYAPGEVEVRTTGMGLPTTLVMLDERESDALARTVHELASILAVRLQRRPGVS